MNDTQTTTRKYVEDLVLEYVATKPATDVNEICKNLQSCSRSSVISALKWMEKVGHVSSSKQQRSLIYVITVKGKRHFFKGGYHK